MFAKAKRRKRARRVLSLAKLAAVGSLVPLMDRFPEMAEPITERGSAMWDFFATVAAVGSGMFLAYRDIPQREVAATEKAVATVLNEWDAQGNEAYLDLVRFVARRVQGGSTAEVDVAVGAWLMWNIKGAEPTKKRVGNRGGHWIDALCWHGGGMGVAQTPRPTACPRNGLGLPPRCQTCTDRNERAERHDRRFDPVPGVAVGLHSRSERDGDVRILRSYLAGRRDGQHRHPAHDFPGQ